MSGAFPGTGPPRVCSFPLPPDWGSLECAGPFELGSPFVARSYNHRNEMLCWRPGPACSGASRVACDWEHPGRFDPSTVRLLERRIGLPASSGRPAALPQALASWVATEVLAKLADQPILLFLRRYGLQEIPSLTVTRLDLGAYGSTGQVCCFLSGRVDSEEVAAVGWVRP